MIPCIACELWNPIRTEAGVKIGICRLNPPVLYTDSAHRVSWIRPEAKESETCAQAIPLGKWGS